MWSEELKLKTRKVFEKRYKRPLSDAEVDRILRWSVRFLRSLR